MTGHGEKISNISVEELQEQLAEVKDDGKAVKRLFVAIEYKKGRSPAEMEERYGISRQTVYNWLNRFEEDPINEAIYDDHPPGPQRKLTEEELSILEGLLEKGAETYGFTGQLWTGERVATVIEEEFGISVSCRTALRYLKAIDWSNKKPKRVATERNTEAIEQFRNEDWYEIRNEAKQEDRTVVFVDETKFRLLPVFRYTWAPEGEEATVETPSSFNYIAVISALTYVPATREFGLCSAMQRYNFSTESIFPFLTDVTLKLSRDPIFVLDNWKPHITAMDKLEDEFTQTPIEINAEYLPEYSSDLNPVDRVWGRAKHAKLPNYAPKSLDELEQKVEETLDEIQANEEFLRSCIEYAGLEIES